MGQLMNGKWVQKNSVSSNKKGSYARLKRGFLDSISKNHPRFQPESNRYHLYISYACPWAQRTLLYRQLKSLEPHISVSIVHPDMLNFGWTFSEDFPDTTGDTLYQYSYLYELYQKADPRVTTSVTVPVLWDKQEKTIVNNESSHIIRLFNSAFNELTGNHDDYYQEPYRHEIDTLNDFIYEDINNGVYQCGFSKTQASYDQAAQRLFKALDDLDDHLSSRTYLVGEQLTEADLRLLPTLLRFDLVYVTHFKCNLKRIADYPALLCSIKFI